MREEERTGVFPYRAEWPEVLDPTCPGYLVALPEVAEAARLVRWWETGQLAARLNAPVTGGLAAAIDILVSQSASAESWAFEELARENRG